MPLPLAPIATVAMRYGIRYGMVALTTYAIARSIDKSPRDQRGEDALDDLPEGLAAARNGEQANGSARLKRTFRVGPNGPGVEVDLSAIGRLKVKRVKSGA
jgi:hypothetical protein